MFVAGHPRGGELQFSLSGVLLDHNDLAVQYDSSTSPGSGGSPVMNKSWAVIGMHRMSGRIPSLSGNTRISACQAVSLIAVRRALMKEYG